MKILKRIKRIVELSKKDQKALEVLENLTPEQLEQIPDEGDGKAVFFAQATEKDFVEFEREQTGLKGWYERLKNL